MHNYFVGVLYNCLSSCGRQFSQLLVFWFPFCFCGYGYCFHLKLHLNNLMMVIMYVISGYISTLRNNVRSRAWGAAIGCSYRVERCCIVKVVSESLQSLLLSFAIFTSWSYLSRCSFICLMLSCNLLQYFPFIKLDLFWF